MNFTPCFTFSLIDTFVSEQWVNHTDQGRFDRVDSVKRNKYDTTKHVRGMAEKFVDTSAIRKSNALLKKRFA